MKHTFLKSFLSFFIIFTILISTGSCGISNSKLSDTYTEYFDTVTTLTVINVNKKDISSLSTRLESELLKYHRLFDIYNEYDTVTNLKKINSNAGASPLYVDSELFEFLKYAINIYDMTNGYVNIAMGSVLTLWHDCRTNAINKVSLPQLPDSELLGEAAMHTDINNIILNEEGSTVFLADKDISLDVGAIAKGYTAQRLSEILKDLGYNDFVLNIGGNIVASGLKKANKKWQVGVEDPTDTTQSVCTLEISDLSVVTSGSYHRYYTVDGTNYHHIINPYTLYPENNYLSVTVVCDDSALADATSTALFNMPINEGNAFVSSNDNLEAMWILSDGSVVYSENFEDHIIKHNEGQ